MIIIHYRFLINCLTLGVVTSPNHPDNYPHNIDKTEQITVQRGKILRLEFTHFDVESKDDGTCPYDYVTIKNGDGNTPLQLAVENKKPLVEKLLRNKTD